MRLIYCLLIVLLTSPSYASPTDPLVKIGEGEMSVLFWSLYKAELYGSSAPFNQAQRPLALKITYLRDIKRDDLIDATEQQWKKIDYTHSNIELWLQQLKSIWPDIKKNDVLTIRVEENLSHFYQKDTLIGTVNDADFGPAFMSIWLSDKTTRPDLRKQLLGLSI